MKERVTMTPVERMEMEKDALDENIQKLTAFMLTLTFDNLTSVQQTLMRAQLGAMQSYSHILSLRIAAA